MKVVVATFNQEKALVGAFFVIMNLRMDLFEALEGTECGQARIYDLAWVAAKYTVMEMSSISVHS